MKYGYMAGYRGDLISEIEFVKDKFDFIKLTFQPENIDQYIKLISKIKDALNQTEIIGHLTEKFDTFESITKNIKAFKFLGVKKITIHPFQNFTLKENINLINKVNNCCTENNIVLMIENLSKAPFCFVSEMKELFDNITNIKFTLDVGHANLNNQLYLFFENFKDKINHVHIHDNLDNFDHLFFSDKNRFYELINKLRSFDYNDTVLLETFAILENGKSKSVNNFKEIKIEHMKQIKKLNLFQ